MNEVGEELSRCRAFLADRRARLETILERRLDSPLADSIPADRRSFLREEAEELFWNEFSWERVIVKEAGGGDEPVELAFAGFLAFIEGLLLSETAEHVHTVTVPRTAVVEDVLLFLSGRCLAAARADGHDSDEFRMIQRLIDLVLYRLHEIPVEPAPPTQRIRPPRGLV